MGNQESVKKRHSWKYVKGDTNEHVTSKTNLKDAFPENKVEKTSVDMTAVQELPSEPVTSGSSLMANQVLDRRKSKEKKIGHRRVDEGGQITFKKIQSSQIMGSIQLGISNAIGRGPCISQRDLLMHDFTIVETVYFPKDGSSITPAHRYSDFRFKAYAPDAFRYFRELFGIRPEDFLYSLCSYPMRELTNPGASGSIFYLTYDDEFIIKTVQHKEAEFLQKLLPGYYMNLNQNPRTLLPKFFSLYCYQCGNKNVRLIVMNNLLPYSKTLHEKYDLKGSTYKRKANKHERKKSSPTFKDLDFMERHPDGIYLEVDTYNALMKTIQRDCLVLESFKIMDYSLLIGIHNLDQERRDKMEQQKKRKKDEESSKISDYCDSALTVQASSSINDTLVRSKSINRQRLAAFSTALESIQAEIEHSSEDEDVAATGGIPAKNAKGDRLLLFLGIIDILQSFRLRKKIEHTWKSVLHDGDTVSVHRPNFYANRFLEFMGKTVFKKIPAVKLSPPRRKSSNPKQRSSAGSESDMARPLLPKIPYGSKNVQKEETSVLHSSSLGNESSKDQGDFKNDTVPPMPDSNAGPHKVSFSGSTEDETTTPSIISARTNISSLSQVNSLAESAADTVSETSNTSIADLGSILHTMTWTPSQSVEETSPNNTEGTPSFTESSLSDDAAYPSTPEKSVNKNFNSIAFSFENNFKDCEIVYL